MMIKVICIMDFVYELNIIINLYFYSYYLWTFAIICSIISLTISHNALQTSTNKQIFIDHLSAFYHGFCFSSSFILLSFKSQLLSYYHYYVAFKTFTNTKCITFSVWCILSWFIFSLHNVPINLVATMHITWFLVIY